MFSATLWLSLVTLCGLTLGFAREWLLVNAWGAGPQSDAFLVAVFLPEAVRMTLAAGLLSAAAIPLYLAEDEVGRRRWLQALTPQLLLIAVVLSAALGVLAPVLVQVIGMGLSDSAQQQASESLAILVWCIPGLLMHALFSVPLQAKERFVVTGFGSLLFNLPAVVYLIYMGGQSRAVELAGACVLGSVLMAMQLLPSFWQQGWRPWQVVYSGGFLTALGQRMWPLLGSNAASQALTLLERMVASLLGEGMVTWVNFARKLINLPLMALMSLNQVLLGLMSSRAAERLLLLKRGVETASVLALPAGIGLVGAAPALVALLLPTPASDGPLPWLLACFALPMVFGCWNALLARFSYAQGNTREPLRCELLGSLVNALALLSLPWLVGAAGIALAALAGVVVTALALMHRQNVLRLLPWQGYWSVSALLLAGAALGCFSIANIWQQLGLAVLLAALIMLFLAFWLKPWRIVAHDDVLSGKTQ